MKILYKRRHLALALAALIGVGAIAGALRLSKTPAPPTILAGDGVKGPAGMVWVPGGTFLMGSDARPAQPNERPAHPVKVGGYWIDQYGI